MVIKKQVDELRNKIANLNAMIEERRKNDELRNTNTNSNLNPNLNPNLNSNTIESNEFIRNLKQGLDRNRNRWSAINNNNNFDNTLESFSPINTPYRDSLLNVNTNENRKENPRDHLKEKLRKFREMHIIF